MCITMHGSKTVKFQWVLKEIRWRGMDWVHLVQPRDGWQAVVNSIMNLGVS